MTGSPPSNERFPTQLTEQTRVFSWTLLLVLAVAVYVGVVQTLARPFWFDEIATVVVARLRDHAAVWAALAAAADGNPPGYYWLLQYTRLLVADEHLAFRLPSAFGLAGTVLFVFLFLRRRLDSLSALSGAAFILATQATYYAAEARPYTLLLCGVSAALLAWQRRHDSRLYPSLLALALAASVSVHYYAVFVWPSIVAAEAAASFFERRRSIGTWIALLAGALPLVAFAPILRSFRQQYGTNFWSTPSLSQLFTAPGELLGVGGSWGAVFTIAAALIVLETAYRGLQLRGPSDDPPAPATPDPSEMVLVMGLLAIPAIAVLVAKLTAGGMTARYMLPAVVGFAVACGHACRYLPRYARVCLLALLLSHAGVSTLSYSADLVRGSLDEPRREVMADVRTLLDRFYDPNRPMVISSGHDYLQMHYYTAAQETRPFYVIADRPAAVRFSGSDSVDLALLLLGKYTPLRVLEYDDLVARWGSFLVVSRDTGRFDYLPGRLVGDGYRLTRLKSSGKYHVYLVDVGSR